MTRRGALTIGLAGLVTLAMAGTAWFMLVSGPGGPARLTQTRPLGCDASATLPISSRSYAAAIADFNGDGVADIQLSRHENKRKAACDRDAIWVATEDGYALWFQFPSYRDRHGCAPGDFDGDGRIDLYCALGGKSGGAGDLVEAGVAAAGKANELWINTGEGFEDRARQWNAIDPYGRGRFPQAFDANGDGLDDLYVTNEGDRADDHRSENMLLLSDGSAFSEVHSALTGNVGSGCLQTGDVDGNGSPDVLLCNPQMEPRLFLNDGGVFTDVTEAWLGADARWVDAALGDLDGDGFLDLVVARRRKVDVFLQTKGKFVLSESIDLGPVVVSVAVADLDGDGGLDIYVARRVAGCDDPDTDEDAESSDWAAPDAVLFGPDRIPMFRPPLDLGCADFVEPTDNMVLVLNGSGRSDGPVEVVDADALAAERANWMGVAMRLLALCWVDASAPHCGDPMALLLGRTDVPMSLVVGDRTGLP